jgi:hypothetical protein
MLPVGDLKRVGGVAASRVGVRSRRVIRHDIVEAMPGDPTDLAQCRLDLRAAVVAQPRDEPGRDGVLLVVPGTDDEREAEFGLVRRIGVLEPGDLLFAENVRVETGATLLGRRFARERSRQRRPSHEVGMRLDQCELSLLAGPRHDLEQCRVKRFTGAPGTRVPCLGRNPGRCLEEESELLHKCLAVEG